MLRTFLVAALLVASGTLAPAQIGRKVVLGHRPERLSAPVPELLQRAIRASNKARFSGRRTIQFRRGQRIDSHEEIVFKDGQRSRVEFPEGSRFAGQIIVEDGIDRRQFLPEKNEVLVSPARHEEALMRLQGLVRRGESGKISLNVVAGDRVAGFQTDQIVVSDNSGNVVQRILIEPRSGLLLKRQMFDPGGALVGEFQFTQINLNSPPFDPSIFKFERKGVRVVMPEDGLREIAQKSGFVPTMIPASTGYRLDNTRVNRIDGQEVLVESYWSRHGKLTLFELKTNVREDMLQRFNRDDIHTAAWQGGGRFYVLVGNLDVADLERIRQSIGNGTP